MLRQREAVTWKTKKTMKETCFMVVSWLLPVAASRRSCGGASEQAPEKARGKGGRVSATATTKPAAPYNDGHHTLL
jgi:hypothetical protein